MKIIVISGTPGTGKTSVSKRISELYNARLISLNKLAISESFDIQYDKKRETYLFDTEKFVPYVLDLIEEIINNKPDYLVIEGHFSDIIPEDYIDYVIILRCDPDILIQRLKERAYKKEKILENLQTEILGNCANYFIQKNMKLPIFEIDTSFLNIDYIVDIIINDIIIKKNVESYLIGKTDWLEKLFQENRLMEFFNE